MEGQSWKEASSLIIVSNNKKCLNNQSPGKCDYRLLMTKRSAKSSFLASAFVFPGGHLEESDFSSKWLTVFRNAGYSETDLQSVSNRIKGPRPPIVTDCQTRSSLANQSSSDELLSSDVGLRICAIRETFEETGVLLTDRMNLDSKSVPSSLSSSDMEQWRKRVRNNGNEFISLCLHLNCAPNIWQLREWWNWLTPNAFGHKRFDTMFYIYCTEKQLNPLVDGNEVSRIEWYSPQELLDLHVEKRAFLAPPQVYELSRLSSLNKFISLKEFAINREQHGLQRWRPLMIGYQDGTVLLLPGDDVYGKSGSDKERESVNIRTMPTMEEARAKVVNVNRIEFRVPVFYPVCNRSLPFGHLSPSLPAQIQPVLRSSL